MKKFLKVFLLITCSMLIVLFSLFIILSISLNEYKLNEDKLINLNRTVNFYDVHGNLISEKTDGKSVVEISKVNDYTKNAFIAIEDKRFYSHSGIDLKSIFRAVKNNILSGSYKEGASTITQQLIKNTHLTSEKTIKRKFAELKLAKDLEKVYDKEQILEMYLNTIYFGDNCYGIENASNYYFGKKVYELNISESAGLAGMIKAPNIYSPSVNIEKFNERKNLVLNEMYMQGYINKFEYEKAKNEYLSAKTKVENNNVYDYIYIANKEYNQKNSIYPYNYNKNVFTYFTPSLQKIIDETISSYENNYEKTIVITNKNGDILAYLSTCGEMNRQMGSIAKPLLVYAPAIQENLVSEITPILDEKTDFNGYSPSNYNDIYHGYLSVKDSLAKSSNVCAVKLLNYLTLNKAKEYANKLKINLTDNDNSLILALGATERGATLTQLVSGYNIFANDGVYTPPSCIKSYNNKNELNRSKIKVIDTDTAFIMCDMLKNVVKDGTAKKLSYLDFDVYAKTGTVGDKNGNTDAYCISYTNDYVVGVWVGVLDKNKADNTLTGGGLPTMMARDVYNAIYKDTTPAPVGKRDDVLELKIDKISYEQNHELILSDDNAPERLKMLGLFRKQCAPKIKSDRFTTPLIDKPKSLVIQNEYIVSLCQTEYVNVKIYKVVNGKKIEVHDTKTAKDKYNYKEKLVPSNVYEFIAIPYYDNGKKIFYGKEIVLDKIKMPSIELGDWWIENL